MRALAALIVVVFVLMPGCTYFEGEEAVEQDIVVDAIRGCTDETACLLYTSPSPRDRG